MATNYTKVNIEQLTNLSNKLKSNSQDIHSSISSYVNNLQEIDNANYLQGVADNAILSACNNIKKTCEQFKDFAEQLSNKIGGIAKETDEIEKTEAKKEEEIFSADPTTFDGGTSTAPIKPKIPTDGKTIDIPKGLGNTHSYMGWQTITSKTSNQYKLRQAAGENYDSEGFAKIDDRYVIACTSTYGKVGDYVDFYQEDGSVIHGVIGDIKNQGDSGCNEWGHNNGNCVVEYIVDKNTWYSSSRGGSASNMHANPGSASFHPELNQDITHAVNVGNYYEIHGK